ncbi:MAG: hotdog fold thioesterase [Wenzhouxiangella sp.]|nr:MAG: hotdog fold thioesterase [Wenzhouxiangella sp.]
MDAQRQEMLLERLNQSSRNTLMKTLEIRYTAVGDDHLEATMPVGPVVHQPMGLLHGGATAALAESVGSAASALRIDISKQSVVGTSLSVHHLRGMREGVVTARAEVVHLGRSTHLWQIRVRDETDRLVADARLTMMVLG